MRSGLRRFTTSLLLAGVMAALIVGAPARPDERGIATIELAAKKPGSPKDFTVTQPAVSLGLVPGGTVPLVISIHNPNNTDMAVTSIAAAVGNSDKADCAAANVTVDALPASTYPLKVRDGKSTTVTLTARMVVDPPNACQGASFPITYTATATGSK